MKEEILKIINKYEENNGTELLLIIPAASLAIIWVLYLILER